MNIWLKRTITLIGRIVLLKSSILSKLIYLWILLPNPPENHKNDKIKSSISTRYIKNGGLNIPDIAIYIQSLKLTWMKTLMNEKSPKWKHILYKKHPDIANVNN